MFFIIAFFALLTLCVVTAAFDLLPLARRFVGRIGIGRWESRDKWRAAAAVKAERQLLKMPPVKVSDNERLTVIDRLRGTYTSKKLQAWQQAALLMGLNAQFGRDGVSDVAKSFINEKIDTNGEWKSSPVSVDFALLAYAVLSSPAADAQRVKPAMDSVYSLIKKSTHDGTAFYNGSIPTVRFVDTVGMVCPFLFLYAEKYAVPQAALLSERQLYEYLERGMHRELFLPIHCFDTKSGAPMGIYGWGRGCGWLALGISQSIAYTHGETREKLISVLRSYADALLCRQAENGSWGRQLFLSGAGESSASAMAGILMATAGELCGGEKYKKAAQSALGFIISATRKDGSIDYAQGDTKGIGFYSDKLDTMPAAQGFALMLDALAENPEKAK